MTEKKIKNNMSSSCLTRGSRNKALHADWMPDQVGHDRKEEQGRSMVEMLGVLAVVGVLSVGGIAGYTYAMNKHYANELLNGASQRAVILKAQKAAGLPLSLREFDGLEVAGGTFESLEELEDGSAFIIPVSGVKGAVCENLIKATEGTDITIAKDDGETLTDITETDCDDENDNNLVFVFETGETKTEITCDEDEKIWKSYSTDPCCTSTDYSKFCPDEEPPTCVPTHPNCAESCYNNDYSEAHQEECCEEFEGVWDTSAGAKNSGYGDGTGACCGYGWLWTDGECCNSGYNQWTEEATKACCETSEWNHWDTSAEAKASEYGDETGACCEYDWTGEECCYVDGYNRWTGGESKACCELVEGNYWDPMAVFAGYETGACCNSFYATWTGEECCNGTVNYWTNEVTQGCCENDGRYWDTSAEAITATGKISGACCPFENSIFGFGQSACCGTGVNYWTNQPTSLCSCDNMYYRAEREDECS